MYEPIRAKSVHSTTAPPPRAGAEKTPKHDQLAEQLAGHLGALLPYTGVLRRLTAELAGRAGPSPETLPDPEALAEQLADLTAAEPEIAHRAAELAPHGHRTRFWQGTRLPAADTTGTPAELRSLITLHEQAHALAGRALVAAAARQDTVTAMLACRRMDAHGTALESLH
jgi:hypothetical protein